MLKLAPLKLSVLIPTVPSRKPLLDALLSTLYPQLTDEVELIAILDNKKRTLGQKRREMIKLAQGKYVTFIDDDDEISADYVSEILKGIETDVDLVCYQSEVSING
jgi:glycosyltransferase involved in cell wall biosynthesis